MIKGVSNWKLLGELLLSGEFEDEIQKIEFEDDKLKMIYFKSKNGGK